MLTSKIIRSAALILSGGAGSRVAFASTIPKQFVKFGSLSTFQLALNNVRNLADIYVVTTDALLHLARCQAMEVGLKVTFIVESLRRDTYLATKEGLARIIAEKGSIPVLIMPADGILLAQHLANDLLFALAHIRRYPGILLLGISCNGRIATELGHIVLSPPYRTISKVRCFVEKPAPHIAQHIMQNEHFLWHSGISVCNSKILYDLMKGDFSGISLDKAVFSQAKNLEAMMLRNVFWMDIGSPRTFSLATNIILNYDVAPDGL